MCSSGSEDAPDTQTAEPEEEPQETAAKKRKLEAHKAKKKKTVQVTQTDGDFLLGISEIWVFLIQC